MLPTFKKSESDTAKSSPILSPSVAPLGTRAAASPLRVSTGGGSPSIIGPDLVITGNLVSRGEVQIDGEVQGDIHGTHIVVGERAKITGGIIAEEIVVRGHVMGSVRGKRVLLQNASHVEGDIYHQTLAIEQGAFFEGKSRRSDDPTGGYGEPAQRRPAAAAPPQQAAGPLTPPPLNMPPPTPMPVSG
ncbi:MAG: bactofilin family protein [Hyphomicrobium sp.]